MNMNIAQARSGVSEVVKNLGVIEPNKSMVTARQAAGQSSVLPMNSAQEFPEASAEQAVADS